MAKQEETLKLIGRVITNPSTRRDAVHIAVIPVQAGKVVEEGKPWDKELGREP